jgi:hypothetical protein
MRLDWYGEIPLLPAANFDSLGARFTPPTLNLPFNRVAKATPSPSQTGCFSPFEHHLATSDPNSFSTSPFDSTRFGLIPNRKRTALKRRTNSS